MTERRRTFTFLTDPPPPLEFTVEGRYSIPPPAENADDETRPTSWAESFTCYPTASPMALAELAMARRVDGDGNAVWNAGALIGFVRRALVDDDNRRRWAALTNDANRALEVEQLGDVVVWLAEVYTDRPTAPPST